MVKNEIPDGCKRRTDNHPVLDLPSIDGTQLFLNHLAVSHDTTRSAEPVAFCSITPPSVPRTPLWSKSGAYGARSPRESEASSIKGATSEMASSLSWRVSTPSPSQAAMVAHYGIDAS